MTFYVKDPATDEAVRRLAKLKNQTLTETIREAVEKELHLVKDVRTLDEKLDEITEMFKQFPKSGLKADKAFFDELSGDT